MIILQIISVLLLFPLTALIGIFFHISFLNGLGIFLVGIIIAIYAALWGVLFLNSIFAVILFSLIMTLYLIRRKYLIAQSKQVIETFYPSIYSNIYLPALKNRVVFIASLSFLKFHKLLPFGLTTQQSEIIDEILLNSKGTEIQIHTDEINIHITIQ